MKIGTEDRSLVIDVDPGRPTPELVRKMFCFLAINIAF